VCGEVLAEARIDSGTQESFNKTLAQMMRELPPRKAAELNAAIVSLPFAGMTSIKDTPADGVVKLDLKKIDGMTAEQIIDLARRTVTVKLSSGPPPGLPQRFKAPLRAAPTQTEAGEEVASLAGTQWDLTDDLNGFISHMGTVDESKSMQGAAANINGSEWTWVARRSE
jgi:hypothetical protein